MLWWEKHSFENLHHIFFCYCIALPSSLQATRKIEILQLPINLLSQQCALMPEHFQNLRKLRFLQCDGLNLVGDFEHQFPKLRWLSWHDCPSDFMATNLNLENLAILELRYSKITKDWEGWNRIKVRIWHINLYKVLGNFCYLQNDKASLCKKFSPKYHWTRLPIHLSSSILLSNTGIFWKIMRK